MKITPGKVAVLCALAAVVIVGCVILAMPEHKGAGDVVAITEKSGYFLPVYVGIVNKNGSYEVKRTDRGDIAIPQLGATSINRGLADSLFYDMQAVKSMGVVQADKQNLGNYHLDSPQATALLRDEAGNELTLYLGAKSPLEDGYYVTTSRPNDGVYLVDAYYVDAMTRSLNDYTNLQLVDFAYESNFNDLKRVLIEGKNRLTLEFVHTQDGFMMTQPVEHLGAQEDLKVILLTPLLHLRAAENLGSAGAGNTGLDDPEFQITLDYRGREIVMSIGQEIGDKRYIAIEGREDIYLIASEKLEFLKMDYRKLLGEAVYFRSIGEVQDLTVVYGAEVYAFQITSEDRNIYHVTQEGEPVDSGAFFSLYNKIIEMPLLKKLDSTPTGNAAWTITVGLIDGRKDVVRLFKLNEREYAIEINGKAEFSTLATAVDLIRERLWILISDRLPS